MRKLVNGLQNGYRHLEKRPVLSFVLISLLIFTWQGYVKMLLSGPAGLHFIRQTDSLAFYLRFYQDVSSLFHPAVLSLLSDEGRVASEFPILYYLSAVVARLVGNHPAILRCIDFAIIFSGLICLFRLQHRLLGNFILALAGTWVAFSSVIFFYYAGNFLPDIPALGFCLCGWYAVYLYFEKGGWRYLLTYNLLFLLSGLLKVTFLVNTIALPAAVFLFLRNGDYFGTRSKRQLLKTTLLSSLPVLVLCASWYLYARQYNAAAHDTYFLVKARPVWEMSSVDIATTWQYFTEYWFYAYYHPNLWWFFAVLFVFLLYRGFSRNSIFEGLFILLFAASVSILLLFFSQFRDHDYYFLVFLPFFAFLSLGALLKLKAFYPRVYRSVFLKIILLALVYSSMGYARNGVRNRLQRPDMMADAVAPLKTYAPFLQTLDISPSENVLILGDMTPDGGLYHLQRKGISLVDSSVFGAESLRRLVIKNDLRIAVSLRHHRFGVLADSLKLQPLLENDSIRIYRIGINPAD